MTNSKFEELAEVIDKLYTEHPELVFKLYSKLKQYFATNEDLNRIIDESNQKFEKLLEQMNQQFKQVDQEFNQVDQHFNQVDQHFNQVDQHFNQVDQHFNHVDQQFTEMREETNKQFTEMREETNKQFTEMREETNKHFKIIEVSLKSLEGKTGTDLENLILDLMKEAIQLESIDLSKIRKEPLYDKEGWVYTAGYSTDIDVVLEDGNLYLIEVKATADNRDVQDLLNKAELYQRLTKRTPTKLILITLRINRFNYQFAIKKNIKVIVGEILQ